MNNKTNHAQEWQLAQHEASAETRAMSHKYTLDELEFMPTISQGHFDDLKLETPNIRVWLSRMTVEDGQPFNNQVTIERLNSDNKWVTVSQYQA